MSTRRAFFNNALRRHCERSEAIQPIVNDKIWIASSLTLLAMTARVAALLSARKRLSELRKRGDSKCLQRVEDERWTSKALSDDFGSDAGDAGAGQADRAGGPGGEVKHTAADERPAIIDGDDDTLAAMGHAQPRAEW